VNIGFAINSAGVTGITTTYTKLTLGAASAVDLKGAALPQAGYAANFELQVLATAGTPTTATVYFTWDTGGDHPMTVAATMTLVVGQTENTYGGSLALDKWFRSPTSRASTDVFAWVKFDSGTVTVQHARLHWCDSLGR
jgi:hypothetical protein